MQEESSTLTIGSFSQKDKRAPGPEVKRVGAKSTRRRYLRDDLLDWGAVGDVQHAPVRPPRRDGGNAVDILERLARPDLLWGLGVTTACDRCGNLAGCEAPLAPVGMALCSFISDPPVVGVYKTRISAGQLVVKTLRDRGPRGTGIF